jgi:sugar O-acyltransferase (sialic acid O-acetyltransferase NeuD family)
MQKILILGAGHHALVVANILLRSLEAGEPVCPMGYLDDNPTFDGQMLLELPILGRIADLVHIPHDALIIAIGDNYTRQNLFRQLQQQGEQFAIARHPTAVIAPDVSIGRGAVISPGVVVNPGSLIGDNVILNTSCTIDHNNHIEDHVHIAPGVHLGGDVKIGEGALIGIGATIMPQRRVGAWSSVGAGSLVYDDVPEHVVVIGVPSRVVRRTHAR